MGVFDDMDKDSDGNLSNSELKKYVEEKDTRLKVGRGIWKDFVDLIDADELRKISRQEFVVCFSRVTGKLDQDPVQLYGTLFDAINVSHNGRILYDDICEFEMCHNRPILSLLGAGNLTEMVKKMNKAL